MTGKVVSIITARVPKELWKNARDSIFHALEHFSELSLKYSDGPHHKKWIVLSVHHAAEAFCNMLLMQFGPGNGPVRSVVFLGGAVRCPPYPD